MGLLKPHRYVSRNFYPGRVPENWRENVNRMLSCGDIAEGYYEYYCQDCGVTRKVGFTCKSRLCLRCFKVAVDDWFKQAKSVLFEGVVHRQVVLTLPKVARPLVMADERFLKTYMDAGATAVKELIEQWRPKQKIRVGIMAVLQLHGRAGNRNPHLHFVVSEGGLDQTKQWRNVNYFDTKKLRKKWQYHVITALKKAVCGTRYEAEWSGKPGSMFRQYPSGFDCDCMPEKGPVERLVTYLCKYVSSPPISIRRIEGYDGVNVTYRYQNHRRGEVRVLRATLSARFSQAEIPESVTPLPRIHMRKHKTLHTPQPPINRTVKLQSHIHRHHSMRTT